MFLVFLFSALGHLSSAPHLLFASTSARVPEACLERMLFWKDRKKKEKRKKRGKNGERDFSDSELQGGLAGFSRKQTNSGLNHWKLSSFHH